jgi:hypothetical protein
VRRAALVALVLALVIIAVALTGYGSHPLFGFWTMKIF